MRTAYGAFELVGDGAILLGYESSAISLFPHGSEGSRYPEELLVPLTL
jgi:hypothetical protein